MTHEKLKLLRVIVPGTMFLVMLLPLPVVRNLFGTDWFEVFQKATFVIVMIGGLYYVLNFRRWFFRRPIERHNAHLKEKLLEPLAQDDFVKAHRETLLRSGELMPIFYKLVDSDASLSRKAQNVYFNGLIFSSVADAQVISLIGMILYSALAIFNEFTGRIYEYSYLINPALVCGGIFMLCLILLPRAERRHRELFEEQAEYIHVHLLPELRKMIHSLQLGWTHNE